MFGLSSWKTAVYVPVYMYTKKTFFFCLLSGWRAVPETTLEDRVNEALKSMIHDALSGRPASNVALDDDVNDAIGSMLHDAFSGRPASQAFSALLGGGGGSKDADAGRLREPAIPAIGSETKIDDDDVSSSSSSLVVAYDDVVRATSELHVDWSKVRSRTAADRADMVHTIFTSDSPRGYAIIRR